MDQVANVSLDTSEVRTAKVAAPTRAPRRRLLVGGGVVLGALVLAGAGFGAYKALGPGAGLKVASASAPAPRGKIQFGPLAEMPDIRDGVPAIVRTVPANLVERRVVEIGPNPAAAAPPAERAAEPSGVSRTVLRPSVTPAPAEPARVNATQPVASAPLPPQPPAPAPVVAALEPAVAPIQAETPPAPVRRDPEPVGSIQPAPVRPAATTAQPPRSAATETPPLPPVRRVNRSFEGPVPAPAAQRQAATAPRPTAVSAAASAAARPAPQAEERPEIFGLPLPRVVPTGRQIRDAASSVADAITSIPDIF